ncbi:MAG: signal peptidase I [Eubacteriales bacterium]|nr:signal peptidase I [Eubacteriales bacterium]
MDFYQNDEQNLVRRLSSWVVDIVVALAFAWFCLHSFGTQVTVTGQSMVPLLNSGDVVLVNRLAYDLGKPDRMDVVVFEREDNKTNVKRVIGIPGDVVQIRDGILYVNDQRVEQTDGLDQVSLAGLAEDPIELGEKEYFLLGDNRDSSEDSRFANVGNVKEKQIMGKVWLRLFPFIDVKLIHSK